MAESYGLSPLQENQQLRERNAALLRTNVILGISSAIAIFFSIWCIANRPSPERYGVDSEGRAFPPIPLSKEAVPQLRVTRMVSDCVFKLTNHAWTSFQSSVESSINECLTPDGADSFRAAIEPWLKKIKVNKTNLVMAYAIAPFVNSKEVDIRGRLVFKYQGVLSIGERGGNSTGSTRPIDFVMQADVVRVGFDSHPEGVRIQNLILTQRENGG